MWQPWKDCDKMEQQRSNMASLLPEQLAEVIAQLKQPSFRAGQIFGWIHKKQAAGFDEMTNLPAALRQQLAAGWTVELPQVAQKQVSADGTVKYLLRLGDGNCIETVLMRYRYGNTLCVSSQVGCRMGCRFCASTQGGLVRSLCAGEIAGQVYAVMRDTGERISHIVLMGIGEPLDNFDNVMDFITLITHPHGLDLSMRNITLSTCGLLPAMEKLAQKKLGLTLSVSLHGANNATRGGMMPVNQKWPVEELVAACRSYQQTTGRRVSFEYAMVRGVNDSKQAAEELAALLRGMGAHVNLIPVNPVDGSPFGPSDDENVEHFKALLEQKGVNATIRRRLGADISAACGQLRQQAAGGKQDADKR